MGLRYAQMRRRDIDRVVKLVEEDDLPFAVVAKRTGLTARMVSRIIKKERERRGAEQER